MTKKKRKNRNSSGSESESDLNVSKQAKFGGPSEENTHVSDILRDTNSILYYILNLPRVCA